MNQNNLLDWFRAKFKENPESWFKTLEIYRSFPDESERAFREKLIKLYAWGYLERKFQGLALLYRLKPVHADTTQAKSPFDNTLTTEEWKKLR